MTTAIVITILVGHFVGDWLLQPRRWATEKSKDPVALAKHIFVVMLCLLPAYFMTDGYTWLAAYVLLHAVQDWYVWRLARHWITRLAYWEDKRFYDTIAIDQSLHLSTLFILLELMP